MKLSACIYKFFNDYLPEQKGVSPETIKSYRDTFRLLLKFASCYYGVEVDALKMKALSLKFLLAFLNSLEKERANSARTRNQRLAAFKSLSRMIKCFYPQYNRIAERIKNIPQKRYQKGLVGFITEAEILKIFNSVDLKKRDGFRDYTILHLLYDTGLRASEAINISLDNFDAEQKTLTIVGKGNRFRQIPLSNRLSELMNEYIKRYRPIPKPCFKDRVFINQRARGFTRYGLYRLCQRYLFRNLSEKRLKMLSAVHSFRHAHAVHMLYSGKSLIEVKNRLGHEDLKSTMIYLKLDIRHKREVYKRLEEHLGSSIKFDPKLEVLFSQEKEEDFLTWLDSL